MPDAHHVRTDHAIFSDDWDIVITCDSGDLEYAGIHEHMKNLAKHAKLMNFDHHSSNKFFGDWNLVDFSASSTAEVVYRFFQENEVPISQEMAVCLMTGVFTDTGGFSNAATNHRALQMAAEFVERGASIPSIHRATIANKNINTMKLWGKIFSRLRETEDGIAVTYVFKKDLDESGLDTDAIDGMSNYLSQIRDAKAIMVFSEREGGYVKASMRTYRDDIDLAKLAEAAGGGGHKKAAGFMVPGRLAVSEKGIFVTP
jgi:phosphoesterase RecJ-like protein